MGSLWEQLTRLRIPRIPCEQEHRCFLHHVTRKWSGRPEAASLTLYTSRLSHQGLKEGACTVRHPSSLGNRWHPEPDSTRSWRDSSSLQRTRRRFLPLFPLLSLGWPGCLMPCRLAASLLRVPAHREPPIWLQALMVPRVSERNRRETPANRWPQL